MNLPSLKAAYFAWVLLQVITASHGFLAGEYQSGILLTENKLEHLVPVTTLEQMWRNFVIVMVCTVAFSITAIGIIVWQVSKNKKWAKWCLTVFSVFQVYNYTEAGLRGDQIHPDFLGAPYWLFDVIGAFIFLYVLYIIFFKPMSRPIDHHTIPDPFKQSMGSDSIDP